MENIFKTRSKTTEWEIITVISFLSKNNLQSFTPNEKESLLIRKNSNRIQSYSSIIKMIRYGIVEFIIFIITLSMLIIWAVDEINLKRSQIHIDGLKDWLVSEIQKNQTKWERKKLMNFVDFEIWINGLSALS